jgi:hypothetical protein
MQSAVTELSNLKDLGNADQAGWCVGNIVQITSDGKALVDFPGNPGAPVVARSVVATPPESSKDTLEGFAVLLMLENQDPARPIIVGFVQETLFPTKPQQEASIQAERPLEAKVDGKTVVLNAKEEMVLKCGKSTLILRKDGKIIVKGVEVISRATRVNKIKGASVQIN